MATENGSPDKKLRRRFVASVVGSICIVLVGMGWTWQVGQQSNRVAHALHHAQEALGIEE